MTIVPIVIGTFGTVTKGILKGQEDLEVGGRVETIQTTALLKTTGILRRVPETWEICCDSNSRERPSADAEMKNSKRVNDNNKKRLKTVNQTDRDRHLISKYYTILFFIRTCIYVHAIKSDHNDLIAITMLVKYNFLKQSLSLSLSLSQYIYIYI